MRDGDITLTVKSDLRILDLGKRLYEKHGHENHKIQYISQKPRELARSNDDVTKSKNWNHLIKSVKTVSGYDEETHSYSSPSLALKIGHSLQKCEKYLRAEGIKESNTVKVEEAESGTAIFLVMHRVLLEIESTTSPFLCQLLRMLSN